MSNLLSIWNNLSIPKRGILIAVVAATLAAFAVLVTIASKPRMAFLYGGLDPAAAGEILTALEGMDVVADVRGDAIYVPENRRDSVRMALAREGLPQQGQPGFELLDEMNGFATTSEMFDAAYWRAKEGELARTILAIPGVKSVRVHLAVPASSPFSRNRQTPRASVTIAMNRGRLDLQHATSIRYLVALAVPDLEPEQVAVLDSVYGVVLKPGPNDPEMLMDGDEPDRIRRLEQSLTDLVEARVGPGNARVTVSLTIDHERETVSERILDPESRVMMNREASDVQQSDVGGVKAVTVASNLPDGEANAEGSPTRSERNETTETAQFDISEVQRKREKMPGAIARINVAVLVNEPVAASPDDVAPQRAPEELDALRDLIAAAIGFDEARGDVVTVRAMSFHQAEAVDGTVAEGGVMVFLENNFLAIMQVVVPALVVIILAFFVIRPVLMQDKAEMAQAIPMQAQPLSVPDPEQRADKELSPVEELRSLAASRRQESTTVLKSWLGETGAAA